VPNEVTPTIRFESGPPKKTPARGRRRGRRGHDREYPAVTTGLLAVVLDSGQLRPIVLEMALIEEDEMKKSFIALAALAVVSLVIVPLALAGNDGKPQTKPNHDTKTVKFECEATVVSAADQSIEATVTSGTKTVKPYRNQVKTFTVDPDAKLVNKTVDPAQPLSLDALVRGAKIHLAGTIKGTGASAAFTATRVILQKLPKTR
jgi:hypothetical protein